MEKEWQGINDGPVMEITVFLMRKIILGSVAFEVNQLITRRFL